MKKNTITCKTRRKVIVSLIKVFAALCLTSVRPAEARGNRQPMEETMKLPSVDTKGEMTVEQAICRRRTIRSFIPEQLSLAQLAQLLWAAQGITEPGGYKRAAPSAGALYPMDLYVAAGENSVSQIKPGVYHYVPTLHSLSRISGEDLRTDLARASLSQMWMAAAPVNFIITAEYSRIKGKYGRRGIRYAMIEAGHIAQNIYLQAEASGLRAGIVGAFDDTAVNKTLGLPRSHEPLLIMPVGSSVH